MSAASRFEPARTPAALLPSGLALVSLALAALPWGCSGNGAGPSQGGAAAGEPSAGSAPSGPSSEEALATGASTGLDPERPTGSSPEMASPQRAPGTRATYHVPVSAELEPYSNFELDDLRFREHGSEWELEYSLPTLLVGGSQRVSFRGGLAANGAYELRGEAGQVSCLGDSASVRCDEVLTGVERDTRKLEQALAAFSSEESSLRRAVAEHFSDDPIGVLTFPRSSAD